MQLSSDILFFIFFVGVTIVVLVINYYFKKDRVIFRKMAKLESISINRAQQNQLVKLFGIAKYVKEPLQAPLSGRDCIYYQVIVEEKGKNGWHTVVKESAHQDFFIQVREDIALIKAQGSLKDTQMYLVKDHEQHSGWNNEATARLDLFLKKHGKKSTFLFMNRRLRYREGIIENNEHIAVMGIAKWKNLSEPIEGYNYSKILTLAANPTQKLIITDHPTARKRR